MNPLHSVTITLSLSQLNNLKASLNRDIYKLYEDRQQYKQKLEITKEGTFTYNTYIAKIQEINTNYNNATELLHTIQPLIDSIHNKMLENKKTA